MDSDAETDLFIDTQPPVNEDVSVLVKRSVVEYFFLVTYNWNLLVGSPFEVNVREVINDFPEDWIKGPLTQSNRQEKVPIRAFGGGSYSLFCKVEKGGIRIYLG